MFQFGKVLLKYLEQLSSWLKYRVHFAWYVEGDIADYY
jgi:hypothetical protein